MAVSWEKVVEYACRLPEVMESTSYGTPALKVAGNLMARLRTEYEGALAIKCIPTEKEALVGGGDPAFFTTPHYDGYDYVLVNLNLADRREVFELIEDAWHSAAPATLRKKRMT